MWKDIEDWEEFYEINEDGDVRNKQTGHLVIGGQKLWRLSASMFI